MLLDFASIPYTDNYQRCSNSMIFINNFPSFFIYTVRNYGKVLYII